MAIVKNCDDMIRTYGGVELCGHDQCVMTVCIGKYCPDYPKEETEAK